MKKATVSVLMMIMMTMITVTAQAESGGSLHRSAKSPDHSKFMQIRVEPHWLLLKDLNMDVMFSLGRNFALGPSINYMKAGEGVFYGTKVSNRLFMDDKTDRVGFGVRGTYYINGFDRHSALFSVLAKQSKNEVTSTGGLLTSTTEKGEFNETILGMTAGYQWVWSAFTMNVSGGLAHYNHPGSMKTTDNTGTVSQRKLGKSELSYALDAGIGFVF